MLDLRLGFAIVALASACEHQDELVPAPKIVAPESPALDAIRFASSEREPPPPAAIDVPPDNISMPGRLRKWFASLEADERVAVRSICRELRDNPCAGMMPNRDGDDAESITAMYRLLGDHAYVHLDEFCRHRGAGICDTPLVVAFDGEPITFTPARGIAFAFRPGEPASTDWPAASTPWIALDRDGDGAITSGAELFGDSTPLPDGTTAKHGYAALAALDDNRDGVIDWQDRAFASLLLWSDADGDRESSPAELRPLASVIVAIPLAHEIDARCTNGNCEGQRGVMQWRDADGNPRTGAVVDVYLRNR